MAKPRRDLTVWEEVAQVLNAHCEELGGGPFFTAAYVEKSLKPWAKETKNNITADPEFGGKEWFEAMFERGRGGPLVIGRIVRYVGARGKIFPAIITGVVGDYKVNLRAFSTDGPDFIATGIEFRAPRHAKEWTWHWPQE